MEQFAITQLSIFVEDQIGELTEATGQLALNNISIRSLVLADSTDFGVVRIIVDQPEKAKQVLHDAGFSAKVKRVLAVKLEDQVGKLNEVLKLFSQHQVNIYYIYSLMEVKDGIFVFKIDRNDFDRAVEILQKGNITLLPHDYFMQ